MQSTNPPRHGSTPSLSAPQAPPAGLESIAEPPPSGLNDLGGVVPSLSLSEARAGRSPSPVRRGQVEFVGDRAALVAALRRGDEGAAAALFHEYLSLVERTVGRIVGVDTELPDITQEVFMRALRSVHQLRDPQALTDWMLQITVYTATDHIRRRKRKRWLTFLDPDQIEHPEVRLPDAAAREALRATYAVLDRMGLDERTVFALRFIDGMELSQLAVACDCSLATIKRRLAKASARFTALAQREPSLRTWMIRATTEEEPS